MAATGRAIAAWACAAALGLAYARDIPPPPPDYVLDEPGVVDAKSEGALHRLLSEHERVTGEQVVLAVLRGLEGEELVDFTNRVFTAWKVGRKGKNNGVLLALYWEDREARIEVGYGLEPLLTDAKSKGVLEDALIPWLRAGNAGQALGAASLEILRVLESPVYASGKAQDILRTGALPSGGPPPRRVVGALATLFVLFLIGGALLVLLALARRPDLVFTSEGWNRSRGWHPPGGWGGWRRRSGGGEFGGLGGFGGFSGGGGLSGGGGASGRW
jgi:uncharacterized protein